MKEGKKYVINRYGEKSDFKPSMIKNSLKEETSLNEKEIDNVVNRVSNQIRKLKRDNIFTSEVREMVKSSLLKNEEKNACEYDTISVASSEIDKLINTGCSDNANMDKTPETIHKYVADMVFKQYNLKKMPKKIMDAHVEGFIKIHDLEYLEERGNNCCQHDIRYFIKNGVKLDGTGKHTTVAKSARNITSLINHLGQILNVAQSTMAGGQGIAYGNIFLAPYAKGLSYKEIKNAMQAFIFNLNMSYTSRGGQPVFSSLNVELGIPSFLKDEPAYGPGGVIRGVYGDYEEEAELILRALLEVIEEGDGAGKNHLFPNLIISLRDEFMESKKDLLFKCCETVSKVPTPYFSNCDLNGKSMSKALMGCRTSSWNNYTGEWDTDVLRCANLGFVTLNLPRIAYIAKDNKDFRKILKKYLNIARDALLYQESILERNLYENKNLNFLTQINDDTGEYYKYKNSSLSIGFNGLNEALMNLGYDELDTEAGHLLGVGIVKYINNYCKEQRKKDGKRWACFATPAESTAWQFATKDLKDFPDIKYKGTKDAPFYTNSSHCPVDSDIDILDRISYEAKFHPLTLAGNICHLFLGSKPCPNALMDLVKYCKDSGLLFWAFTNDYHYCFDCNNMANGLSELCSECNSKNVENYSRVSGYYQKVDLNNPNQGWNKGKKAELKERYRYNV